MPVLTAVYLGRPPCPACCTAICLIFFTGASAAFGQEAQPESAASTSTPHTVLATIRATADAEEPGKDSLKATTSGIGKGHQELRDIPQSVTVVTEKLIDDRNLDTLKDTLRNTGGISFQAAEGGEEDIRLRGFSLQSSGDIFIDGMRDPAFYERDSFDWDRLEVLRGSASMLFGRGSTGGVVNQVSKQPTPREVRELSVTAGSGDFLRAVTDYDVMTGTGAALRVNGMINQSDGYGAGVSKRGLAPALRWGIGQRDEFLVSVFYLQNDNGINYGLPWLTPGANGGDYLWHSSPRNYYGMASDYASSGTAQGTFSHLHRFAEGGELKTSVRVAGYNRDQRASAIRFAAAALQPGARAVTADTFGENTVLTRGTNNKTMGMDTVYAQSDYSGRQAWFGRENAIQSGVDFADEKFENFATAAPTGTMLTKLTTKVGTPDDGAVINEQSRAWTRNRTFEAKAAGAYLQDLLQVASSWKVLGGLRWDRFLGDYHNIAIAAPANNACAIQPATQIGRSDSLFSRRVGVLFQPTYLSSFHFSYGTSFNTSGDTYQYDAGTANTGPESSRNFELGARLDSASGDFTTRLAVFHSTKYNERNRDADTVNACNYVLSGERHVAGFELDLAGRPMHGLEIYLSYAYLPIARVDSSSGAAGTDLVGSRPGLTPRHGGTIWSTYEISSQWRVGAGLNARSSDKPVGLAVDSLIEAPAFLTGDLMVEYKRRTIALKANLTNLTDEHYADTLYRGHYIPGKPRTLEVTATMNFQDRP